MKGNGDVDAARPPELKQFSTQVCGVCGVDHALDHKKPAPAAIAAKPAPPARPRYESRDGLFTWREHRQLARCACRHDRELHAPPMPVHLQLAARDSGLTWLRSRIAELEAALEPGSDRAKRVKIGRRLRRLNAELERRLARPEDLAGPGRCGSGCGCLAFRAAVSRRATEISNACRREWGGRWRRRSWER